MNHTALAVTVTVLVTILVIAIRRQLNRKCITCGRERVDKGSHFACTVCDFDPDTRAKS